MIIRDQGIVVGMLDDQSLKLTDVASDKLAALVAGWREDGIDTMASQEEPLEGGAISGDRFQHVPFTVENLDLFRIELWKAGFEVQTA